MNQRSVTQLERGSRRSRPAALLAVLLLVFPLAGSLGIAQVVYQDAYDRGYQDGRQAGSDDRLAGNPFDFANQEAYQKGDGGFQGEDQDRDFYIVAYRRGYEDGYEEGFGLQEVNSRSQGISTVPSPAAAPPSSVDPALHSGEPLEIPAGTRVRIKLLDSLSSRRNEKGDRFLAEVKNDVLVGGELAIPRGARIEGVVSRVKRAGRIKGKARMDLEFRELRLLNGPDIPIEGRVVSVVGRSDKSVRRETGTISAAGTKGKDLRSIGTSAGIGALIGILGGGTSGAKTGAAVGSIGGTVGVLATRGRDLDLRSETELVIRLVREVTIPFSAVPSYP